MDRLVDGCTRRTYTRASGSEKGIMLTPQNESFASSRTSPVAVEVVKGGMDE